MRHCVAIVASATILGIGASANAQTQPAAQPQPTVRTAAADPVICEKEPELGSRLSAHKICHTRSEWDQLRRDDRSVTERVQTQRSMDLNGH